MLHHFWIIFICCICSLVYGQTSSSAESSPFIINIEKGHKVNSVLDFWYSVKIKSEDMHFVGRSNDMETDYELSYQQYYKGIKVDKAIYKLHYRNGQLRKTSGEYYYINDLSTIPKIGNKDANGYLADYLSNQHHLIIEDTDEAVSELVIFIDKKVDLNEAFLCYKFEVESVSPLLKNTIYLDAHSGDIWGDYSDIHFYTDHIEAVGLYDDTLSILVTHSDSTIVLHHSDVTTMSLQSSYDIIDATDVICKDMTCSGEKAAIQAHFGAEQARLYFEINHHRNSYDGKGSPIKSYVNFGNKFNNAFWDGRAIYYGDGDGNNFGPVIDLDISGHELTHGVIDHTANLLYHDESGALNESFADIFGEMVEYHVNGSNDWILGARTALRDLSVLRSMKDPKKNKQPDTYKGEYWYDMSCRTSGFNGYSCGIHINSGVQNKWFYILAMGESGTNDLGNEYQVNGIGRQAAAAIAYRSLNVYLSPRSMYQEARLASIHSAIDLFGLYSREVVATTNAWYAVGVGDSYKSTVDHAMERPVIFRTESFVDQLYIQWDQITEAVAYDVYLDSNYIVTTTQSNFVIDSLESNTEYAIYVAAYQSEDTLYSDAMYLKTLQHIIDSSIELNLDSLSDNYAILSWSSTTRFDGFQVFVNQQEYASTSENRFALTSLKPGQDYECWVIGENEKGQIAISDSLNFQMPQTPKTEFKIISGSFFENGWDNWVSSGSKAEWYQGSKSPEGWGSLRIKGGNTKEAIVSSPMVEVKPHSKVKLEITFYAWSMELGDAILIEFFNNDHWTSLDTLVSYYDFDNNSLHKGDYIVSVDDPMFRLRVTNQANASTDHIYLDEVVIRQEELIDDKSFFNVNIEEDIEFRPKIEIWPNPVGQEMHLSFGKGISQYLLINSLGNTVKHELRPISNGILSTVSLPKGIYYVKAIYGDHQIIKGFVKL